MKDLVSVIIPTYKRSSCLIRAINSVLNQTYKKIEIIVVDDNDENSEYRKENEKKLERYVSMKKIIYVKHKKNLNGANARNTGIKKSNGTFITFLDDDDYFLPNRIEKLVNVLNNNKSYGGAYSSVIFEDKSGIITNLFHANYNANLQKMILGGRGFFGTGSNMFFRKSVIDSIGLFDGEFKRHQDFEYMVRFLQVSKIINVDDFLVVKVDFDGINIPNYQTLLDSKKKYLSKFNSIISKYDDNSQKEIYVNQLYNLYSNAPLKEKRNVLKKLQSYGEKKYKIHFKNLKLSLKNKLKTFKFVKKVHMSFIHGKKYQRLLTDLKGIIENPNMYSD